MRGKNILGILICVLLGAKMTSAQRGKDGAKVISGAITNTNEYTILIADASAGNASISVANCMLNGAGNFSGPLTAGDLIMIIQMQGATLNATNDSTWGAVTSYNNCGNYEFAEVQSAPNTNTIVLNCGLAKNYSVAGKVQVIRVPRYSSLTINSGGNLGCTAWNGSTGGVLAVEVSGNTIINSGGKLDVSEKGFRGGQLLENITTFGVGDFAWLTGDFGAEKGEGIGGYQGDYDIYGGRYCKGAAANGGGGGNAHNGGGAGGANGGNPMTWTGMGMPDISNASWISAWNLEYAGLASSSSSGGGKGGYTFSRENLNALIVGPNDLGWGGDKRDKNGGLGGRSLDYSGGRIFLGGGGGAGDQNEGVGGVGGSGGGLIYLINYGIVGGSGQVVANGADGANTGHYNFAGGVDGAGGGGGGGAIIINSSGAIAGVSAIANGGNGGNQSVTIFDQYEAEGPGGGGGGGYIAISNGSITRNANGGNNGTTNSGSLTEFPANGATRGGNGTNGAGISNFNLSVSNVSICYGSTANLNVTVNGSLPGGTTIYWYNAPFGGTVLGNGTAFTTPVLTANATYYVGTCPGTYRLPVTVTVDSIAANFTFSNVCLGKAAAFSSSSFSSGGTINQWDWDFGDGNGTSAQPNPSYSYSSGGSFTVILTVTDNAGCSSTASHAVNVGTTPSVSFSSANTSGCDSLAVQFNNGTSNGQAYLWKFGDNDSSMLASPLHRYASPGIYTVILIASNGNCSATDTIINMITIHETPVADFSYDADCASKSLQLYDSTTGAVVSWDWNFGDGLGSSSLQNPFYIYNAYATFIIELIISGGGGCNDTVTKPVTFTTPPNVSFTADYVSGCDSLSVAFQNNTTNAVSYQWDFGDGNFSTDANPTHLYDNPGTYNVTLTAVSPGGCSIAQSVINLITVNSPPVIPTITQHGDSLISDFALSYQWYVNSSPVNGATNRVYIPTMNGDYFVVVTNSSGCSSSSSVVHFILNGIHVSGNDDIILYPNPVSDYLEINFGTLSNASARAELKDALGKVVWKENIVWGASKRVIIDMKKMSKSVYFLTFYVDDKMSVYKIIKE